LFAFLAAGAGVAYFPFVAQLIGQTATMFGICSATGYGILDWTQQSDVVDEIRLVKEGEHKGKFHIITGVHEYYCFPHQVYGMMSSSPDNGLDHPHDDTIIRLELEEFETFDL
jgi:hypothetical protein